jgi:AraC-like DNA-binding protein
MVHSMPTSVGVTVCETVSRAAPAALRPHTIGYGGFRSTGGRALPHRLLPISVAALVVDLASETAIVTGPRASSGTDGQTSWGYGVTVGLTPAGVVALLGVPMREITGRSLLLSEVLSGGVRATGGGGIRGGGGLRGGGGGIRGIAAELPERIAGAVGWAARFRVLDELLSRQLGFRRAGPAAGGCGGYAFGVPAADPVMAAWGRLQLAGGRLRVGELAAQLGVGRRGLEREFRATFGLSPGAVGRIARFQRSLGLLVEGRGLADVAAHGGYADQSHFTRETRAMAGMTPGELRAFVQYRSAART